MGKVTCEISLSTLANAALGLDELISTNRGLRTRGRSAELYAAQQELGDVIRKAMAQTTYSVLEGNHEVKRANIATGSIPPSDESYGVVRFSYNIDDEYMVVIVDGTVFEGPLLASDYFSAVSSSEEIEHWIDTVLFERKYGDV